MHDTIDLSMPCPCESGKPFTQCCGPYLSGSQSPPTAEALMRSRYTAYTFGNERYLERSWHPDYRPDEVSVDKQANWLGLKIKRTEKGGPEDDEGIVEFVARYKVDGQGFRLHEISRFGRFTGEWVYLDGELIRK